MPKPLVFGTDLIISVLIVFVYFGIVEYVNSLRKDWSKITMAATSFLKELRPFILKYRC